MPFVFGPTECISWEYYPIEQVNEVMADMWNEALKAEKEAAKAPTDLVKTPEMFKKDTKWRQ
jgi:hypothetical protein